MKLFEKSNLNSHAQIRAVVIFVKDLWLILMWF